MRFLIDNALAPQVARELAAAGHDAVHVRDIGLKDARDSAILERAATDQRVIVSADTDFGSLLASRAASYPSVVLFRRVTRRRPADQTLLLLENLPRIQADLTRGAMVVIEETRLRIRDLPISDIER